MFRREAGRNYFFENRIFPLCLTYEEIEEDIRQVLLRIATYVGVKPENVVMPVEESIFTKVRDIRNARMGVSICTRSQFAVGGLASKWFYEPTLKL